MNVAKVDFVCFNIEESNPPLLTIHAAGKVNSSGWGSPILSQRVYVAQPEDGIQDFDLQASPPTGLVLWVISVINADVTIELESWVKGIRVHSATNSITVSLSDISCSVAKGNLTERVLRKNINEVYYFKLPYDGPGGQSSPPPDDPKPYPHLPDK